MGKLFVISAPSGTGKTTVIKKLLSDVPGLVLSVSSTTRNLRGSERDGSDYNFITKNEFEKMKGSGELLEWASVYGEFYGTPKGPVEKLLKEGKNVILDIDVQGARQVKKMFPDTTLIFLLPPSKEELIKRLTGRGTDKKDVLELRIKNAEKELAEKDFYDHQVVNDNIDNAVEKIAKIIEQRFNQRTNAPTHQRTKC